ncbi:MAG: hypothetical protein GY874_07330 [Desulfobacteraceae bacterium]|nr:hypothetical protein [Desulfobacteraceae bacterium]
MIYIRLNFAKAANTSSMQTLARLEDEKKSKRKVIPSWRLALMVVIEGWEILDAF